MSVNLINQQLSQGMPYAGYRVMAAAPSSVWKGVILILAHVPLALLVHNYPQVATLHAGFTLLVGLRWAISKAQLTRVAYVGAYITGAEVLWRMTGASIFWEFGKYSVGFLFIVALLRNGRFRLPLVPLLYFALLLPGIIPSSMNDYFVYDEIRQLISSNLSGPFALMICAWFFSHLKFTSDQFERLQMSIIAPAFGIAIITLVSTVTADELKWSASSNMTSSGGFGPNQVSGALGLGALMALLFLLRTKASNRVRYLMFGVMIFLAAQSALTFSRGGMVGALTAALVAMFYFARDPRSRRKVMFIAAATILVVGFVVLPRLDKFTGGALSARFESTSTTGRTEIIESDLRMWEENPFLGVGVGMSYYRKEGWKATHTEFTRLLAEHGLFGLAALLLLLIAGGQRLLMVRTSTEKAITTSLIVWSVLFMMDKAMRMVAPSFAFGLAFANFQLEEQEPQSVAQRNSVDTTSPQFAPHRSLRKHL